MSIKLQLPKLTDLKPRITVIGVGGAGGNALNNMITSGLTGVEFVAANTDAQALTMSAAEHRLQLGVNLTEGLGAGSKPEVGEAAALEAEEDIRQQLSGSHMCFIAAGMGGGTGTGAAAVIARIAQDLGILTVGVVTKPFQFEGARRMRQAEAGIVELRQHVDTLIVIPNQNLFRVATERTTFADAFRLADQILHSGVACIVDLIVREGLINLDFADVRTVMSGMGNAMMGTGESSGERRAIEAAEAAVHNPLIDDVSLKGAKGLLLSVTGGRDMTLYEVDEAASRVRQEVDPEANIIVGATFDDTLGEKVRVSIVASGIPRAGDAVLAKPREASRSVAGNAPVGDLKQRLSEALSADGAFPLAGAQQQAPLDLAEDIAPEAPRATPPAEVWRGPGDVSIVEAMPQMTQPAPAPLGSTPPSPVGAQASAPVATTADATSTSHPALQAASPQSRRMPDVGDFPPVGQRVYHAKSGGAPVEGANGDGNAPVAPRKQGLLGRLASPFQKRRLESDRAVTQGDSQYDISTAAPDVAQPSFGAAYGADGRPATVPPARPQKRSG